MEGEIKKWRKISWTTILVTRIGKSSIWVPQLVKEWMNHGLDSRQALSRCVLQKLRDEIDGARIRFAENLYLCQLQAPSVSSTRLNHLAKWMRFDLWELVLHVVGIHCTNLIPCRRSQDFNNLNQLINTGLAREQRLSKHKLCHDAARGPHV